MGKTDERERCWQQQQRRWRRRRRWWRDENSACSSPHGKTTSHCRKRLQTAFEETQKTNQGLSCRQIVALVSCFPNFAGCFAQNTLERSLFDPPCTFLVNVDSDTQPGSHWIAIGLFDDSVEMFDPLGCQPLRWASIPCNLLRFIHYHGQKRRVLLSKQIQPLDSSNCAFYCLFYVLSRISLSFDNIQRMFPTPATSEAVLSRYFSSATTTTTTTGT